MKIVIIITGLRGLFYASLEMARRLQIHGHEIVFASSMDLSERLNPYDYEFIRLPSMRLNPKSDSGYERVYKNAIQNLAVNTLIVDIECPVYAISAVSLGKDVFILNHFLPIPTRPDAPFPNQNISPGEGLKGSKWMLSIGYGIKRLKHFVKAQRARFQEKGLDRRSLLINLAEDLGLKKDEFLYSRSIFPGPYLYFSKLPILHITAAELDFQHYLRPEEDYVGPMVFLERKNDEYPEDSKRLQELIDKISSLNRPLVYCALSSLKAVEKDFLEKIINAYKSEALEVVVGLGGKSEIPVIEIPENIHFFKWVDAQVILPHTDVAVITAGFHTIHECIYFEVPMISFSFSTTDQNGFQARIRSKKLGLNGDFTKETPDSLKRKTYFLIESKEHNISLAKMKKQLNSYVENKIFEKLIGDID
ncbi:glycosyltransferase [Algoriphagus sediminis]|uniref:Glycosyltransferase n=1 Tax=Algoriphagus sediminis TaxID=3057113 RepID=A0ABT7Y8X3_9BACT|nr:glycosyltransferase [Algoriphagus sediminis]MDN3202875.1 glycosyltransferase [Algoriphagus sediminis]